MTANYATLLTEMVERHVLLVTLNRPEVSNAVNTSVCSAPAVISKSATA